MSLTDFRETLRSRLESQLGYPFYAGRDHGPELEAIPDDVNGALKAIQTQPGAGFWFFSITGFEIDYDQEWGTEVAVLLRRENPFLP